MRDERALGAVPRWIWALLVLAVAAQIVWQGNRFGAEVKENALPPPPSAAALRLASFGEHALLSRLLMLTVQSYDLPGLDYERLTGWLGAALELDPRGGYPLFAAARVYAEVPDSQRSRTALDFVYRQFFVDPDRRWPWLAHAALLAKHRLGDLPLARRYAQAIDTHTRTKDVPLWARQMEIFILEDMNELEAAKVVLGGLLESGAIGDPAEARFLRERLQALEERLQSKSVK